MPYLVIDGPGFCEDLKTLHPKDERLDEVLSILRKLLTTNPLIGQDVGSSGAKMLWGHPRRALPIRFFYSVDGEQVTILGAVQAKM